MSAIINKLLANGNHDTPDDEPEYLVIHNPTTVQIARWDEWAAQAAEMLQRHGWIARRIGDGVHLQHPFLIGGPHDLG